LLDIIAKNFQQKSPSVSINVRTVLQPNVYYTCPAGKVATVKGRVTCTGLGAASEGRFIVNSTIMYRWQGGGTPINVSVADAAAGYFDNFAAFKHTPLNVYRIFELTLEAGETISTDQNAGTNAEFNVFAEVVELPA